MLMSTAQHTNPIVTTAVYISNTFTLILVFRLLGTKLLALFFVDYLKTGPFATNFSEIGIKIQLHKHFFFKQCASKCHLLNVGNSDQTLICQREHVLLWSWQDNKIISLVMLLSLFHYITGYKLSNVEIHNDGRLNHGISNTKGLRYHSQ